MKISLVLTATLWLMITAGCSQPHESQPELLQQYPEYSIRKGRDLFSHYCSPCHGETGDGFGQFFAYGLEPRPADFTAADFLDERDDERLFLSISESSAAVGGSNLCPPWGNTLTDEEIKLLINHIKELNADEERY